jgi:hypothetical protein
VYDNPNESQKHKHAKFLLYEWLTNKLPITIVSNDVEYDEHDFYEKPYTVEMEYCSNGYRTDVAVLSKETRSALFIFEIKHTHTPEAHRPEPWFEIIADDILAVEDRPIRLNNIRSHTCDCETCLITTTMYRLKKQLNTETTYDLYTTCVKCSTPFCVSVKGSPSLNFVNRSECTVSTPNNTLLVYDGNSEIDIDIINNQILTNRVISIDICKLLSDDTQDYIGMKSSMHIGEWAYICSKCSGYHVCYICESDDDY